MLFKRKSIYVVLNMMIFTIELTRSITLRKECPSGEIHRSCSFYEEYTCWLKADRLERVKYLPKRLAHCRAGCYCQAGFVRQYPLGSCVVAAACQNRQLQVVLNNLPSEPYVSRFRTQRGKKESYY